MKLHGVKSLTITSVIRTYAEKWLRDLVRDHSGTSTKLAASDDSELRLQQRELLESIIEILSTEKAALPIDFLCCLLRSAIFIKASKTCKTELERRISAVLEHMTVDDLLVLSFTYDGERLFDLESVKRIISGFREEEDDYQISEDTGDELEQPSLLPSFPELELEIKEAIEFLGGSVFPKLNWSAPKDSAWINTTGSLRCSLFSEISLLLRLFNSLVYDLCHAYDSCSDKTMEA